MATPHPGPLTEADSPLGYETVEPRAGALVESLRAFGYSPQTAVADLVDNSLAAGASTVTVQFHWAGTESWVAVVDNGTGMTEEGLREAMRPGSTNPLADRRASDLGRFGLGLKTASFSQCRRLTVMSCTLGGQLVSRTWDLDTVATAGQWRLLTTLRPEDRALWEALRPDGQGTIVLWRNLDRLVDPRAVAAGVAEKQFYATADVVGEHLRMVFHRYLAGPGRVNLMVNRRRLHGWDPFLREFPATQPLGDESLQYRQQSIGVRSYVLPHVSRLTTAEYEAAQGPRGWTSHQGFYVYRNRRLIVAGDWLGLGFPRDEATKLARIALDLPNTMDQDWQLDVRKSVVRPPGALVPQLRRIAEVARRASIQVYRHRGKVLDRARGDQAPLSFVWQQVLDRGKVSYRINRKHPLIEALLDADTAQGQVAGLLRLVEETVPVPMIILDHASNAARQAEPFESEAAPDLAQFARDIARVWRAAGLREEDVLIRLRSMEPFAARPDLIPHDLQETQ